MGYKGMGDAFTAKLNVSGGLQWNSFLGSAGSQDYGQGIAVDGIGNVFVAGRSEAVWGGLSGRSFFGKLMPLRPN